MGLLAGDKSLMGSTLFCGPTHGSRVGPNPRPAGGDPHPRGSTEYRCLFLDDNPSTGWVFLGGFWRGLGQGVRRVLADLIYRLPNEAFAQKVREPRTEFESLYSILIRLVRSGNVANE